MHKQNIHHRACTNTHTHTHTHTHRFAVDGAGKAVLSQQFELCVRLANIPVCRVSRFSAFLRKNYNKGEWEGCQGEKCWGWGGGVQ